MVGCCLEVLYGYVYGCLWQGQWFSDVFLAVPWSFHLVFLVAFNASMLALGWFLRW